MDRTYKPKAGRYGTMPAFLDGRQLDAGITASATVKIPLNAPFRRMFVERGYVSCITLPIGGGAITATLMKKPNGAAAYALSAATDITVGLQVAQKVGLIAVLSTITDAQRILQEGELVYYDIIAAGTVTTQPVGLSVGAAVSILE